MRTTLAWVLVIIGGVWAVQGLDVVFAPKSFMSGNPLWVLLGSLAVLAGLGLMFWSRRSRG